MAGKYDNPTKQTWRGWAWNQVHRRVSPGSTVLCLAGDGGFDLEPGKKKGLVPVGIDRIQQNVRVFRRQGGVAICDDIHHQLFAMRPDAAILDFMGGLTDKNRKIIWDAFRICHCVVVNLMRGRDDVKTWRNARCQEKNRGKMCGLETAANIIRAAYDDDRTANETWLYIDDCLQSSRASETLALSVLDTLEPAYYSYRSKDCRSAIYYDSVALTNQIRWDCFSTRPQSVRKAAAAKALLTMRRSKN